MASIAYMVLMSGSSQALYYNPRGRGVFGRNTQPPLVLSAQTPDRGLLLGYPRSGLDGPGPRFRVNFRLSLSLYFKSTGFD